MRERRPVRGAAAVALVALLLALAPGCYATRLAAHAFDADYARVQAIESCKVGADAVLVRVRLDDGSVAAVGTAPTGTAIPFHFFVPH
jgi:hypothetical protein